MNKAYGGKDKDNKHDCARMLVYVQTAVPNAMEEMDYDVMQDDLNCPRLWCGGRSNIAEEDVAVTGSSAEEAKEGKEKEILVVDLSIKVGETKEEEEHLFGSHGRLSQLLPNELQTKSDLLDIVETAEKVYQSEKDQSGAGKTTVNTFEV